MTMSRFFSEKYDALIPYTPGEQPKKGSLIKLNSTDVNYTNIKVQVTVADGKITNIKYSYAFDAVLSLKALVVPIDGNGAAVTKAEFSNIKY